MHTFDNAHTCMLALLHSHSHSERATPHSLALALPYLLSCSLLLALALALVLALVLLVLSLAVSLSWNQFLSSLSLVNVSEQSCTRPTHLCKFSVCQIGLSMTIFAMRYRSIPMITREILDLLLSPSYRVQECISQKL